jgi:23S rRNA (guanosine2251-2'-O)-methyltransferase
MRIPESAPVQCPAAGCGAVFSVREARLGRNVHCPVCRARLTARPLQVQRRLESRRSLSGSRSVGRSSLPLAVLVDNVRSLWNVGSIFRTADACAVQAVYLAGITGHPPRPEISKTALGAESAVDWHYCADPLESLKRIVADGYSPVAIETSPQAVPLERASWPSAVCLVVGNEVAGVSPPVLKACPLHVSIPMRGTKDSLNVAVAFGIAAYEVARSLSGGGTRAAEVRSAIS